MEHAHGWHCSAIRIQALLPFFGVTMVRKFLLSLLVITGSTVAAQRPFHLPGMVQVDDSTFIDQREVSVADWIGASFDTTLGRPVDDVLAVLPYRHI